MKKTSNVIKEKKATLEVLEQLFETLEREESYIKSKTVWFDTDEPRLNEDGSIKTRSDGTTVYKQDYRTEEVPEDEFTDDMRIQLNAINTIRTALEKLV